MKKMKRFLSILLIVAIGSSLLIQQNVYAGITSGDISEHDQTIISAKKYAKKAYKEYAQQSIENANRVIAALRLACNVFDATGSVDLTREAFADYLGGEKGFIWVADDGSYALTKELIDEFKAFLKKQGTGTAHGSLTNPIVLKSQTFENYFNKHYEVWSTEPVHKFCHTLNLFDMFDSKLDSNDFVYSSHRDADNECIHLLDNYSNLSKYEYQFFYGGFTSDVEIGKYVATWGLGGAVYNAQTGKTVDHLEGRYSYCLTGSETVTEGDYDGYSYWCVRLSDTVYDCPTMATSDGRPFFYFSNYADGVQYYDSLFSSLNKAGLTINNYNKVIKYVNDDDPSGFIVVSPDDNIDVEPTDYTFDTPTDPGDSGGGSDSGGGAPTGDSSGIIKAINNLYDMLEQKLDKIISQIRTNNILTGLDLLNDIFNDYIKDFAAATTELGTTVKSKFPFCLPFVIAGALALTNKSATAPKFTIPFKYDAIGVNYDIVIDFSDSKWSACRNVIYYFTLFFYMFGLIYLTFKASKVKE